MTSRIFLILKRVTTASRGGGSSSKLTFQFDLFIHSGDQLEQEVEEREAIIKAMQRDFADMTKKMDFLEKQNAKLVAGNYNTILYIY